MTGGGGIRMVSGYGWSLILVTLHAIKVSKTLVQASRNYLPKAHVIDSDVLSSTHFFYASRGGFGGRGMASTNHGGLLHT